MNEITEKQAQKKLEEGYENAEKILNNTEKLEKFLQNLERKLKVIPIVGNELSKIPVLISLVRDYVSKEYKEIPLGSIIAILSALIYTLSPVDFIPDSIPGAGYIDDAAVVAACFKLVESDVDDYLKWRKENKEEYYE